MGKIHMCDFCGKDQNDSNIIAIITGNNDTAICDKCVSLCAVIILAKIAENNGKEAMIKQSMRGDAE